MVLKFQTIPFDRLTISQLYAILNLRSAVFVVEQNCIYPDIDNKDQLALHILGYHQDQLIAYSRIFNAGRYYPTCAIGRVVVANQYRQKKLGHALLEFSIQAINVHFGSKQITIAAQLYLQNFYQSYGFIPTSDPYLEDGILHIEMQIF
jgi:ElaA protein